jgi:hypothetical protein
MKLGWTQGAKHRIRPRRTEEGLGTRGWKRNFVRPTSNPSEDHFEDAAGNARADQSNACSALLIEPTMVLWGDEGMSGFSCRFRSI